MREALQILIAFLPRYPEEGSDASSANKQEVFTALINQLGAEQTQAIQTTLDLIENLLTSLSLLDSGELQRGEWKFVSHPAQLCALSLLQTLADPRQKLFPSSFWQTAGVGDEEKRQQKNILQALEKRRQACHLDGNAPPIRFIYVAWSLIKLDDKILFHQREAREHVNEYGLVGGRANAADLRQVMGEGTPNGDLLKVLQAPDSPEMFKALEIALDRECKEEVGLTIADGHYTPEIWRNLTPWQDCMGAAPNYALTQYFFRLYHLQLTTSGYLTLCTRLREQDARLIQCTLDEVASGITADRAKKLKIDAIYDDFPDDREALKQSLENLAPSYVNRYSFDEEKDALVFSLESKILQGGAGKERPLLIDLDTEEKQLFIGLAVHAKGFTLNASPAESVTLHEYGWIEIHDSALEHRISQLSERLRATGIPYLEMADRRYARLSLPQELIFFDPCLFSFDLQQQDKNTWHFRLRRAAIPTAFGDVLAANEQGTLESSSLGMQLKKVEAGGFSVKDDEHLSKKVRSALQKVYQSFGLRQLLMTKDKCFKLVTTEVFHP